MKNILYKYLKRFSEQAYSTKQDLEKNCFAIFPFISKQLNSILDQDIKT